MHPKHPQTFGFISPPTIFFFAMYPDSIVGYTVIQTHTHTYIYYAYPIIYPLYVIVANLPRFPGSFLLATSGRHLQLGPSDLSPGWGPKWNAAIFFLKKGLVKDSGRVTEIQVPTLW